MGVCFVLVDKNVDAEWINWISPRCKLAQKVDACLVGEQKVQVGSTTRSTVLVHKVPTNRNLVLEW